MSRSEFYRLVSGVIRDIVIDYPADRSAFRNLAVALGNAFAKHNTKFDMERFLRDARVK
jgi:hypothetical protein